VAKEKYHEAVNAGSLEELEKVSASVRKDMESGGRYEYVSPTERQKVDQKLTEMETLLQHNGPAELKEREKIQLFNAQEVVNSILAHRDRDRVICKSEAPIGSHIPVTTCHTYAQEVEARKGAQRFFDDVSKPQCSGGTGAGFSCGGVAGHQ
jgi:predicted secreted protein